MLFYLNSPLDEEASHIPKLVFFGESYGARRCWTSATRPHFTLRQGGHRKVRKSCHPTIGEAIQRRHAPREFFCPTTKKKDRSLQVGSFDTLTPSRFPPQKKKQKKNAAGIYEYNPGRFFWLDFVWQKYWWVPTKKRIGPTWKKAWELKTGSEKQKQQKTHGNFCHDPIFQANHGSLAFSFYFPPVLLGKKKKEKTTAPNKQPQNNQDFTFFWFWIKKLSLHR